jgi:isopentenyl-diphosphate Delta-isomerase
MNIMNENLILVDENDQQIGGMDKMSVHRHGYLHRAFSVFIFNSSGELMLQQRADHKYHSGGLWTNTCCSHPRDGEETEKAVSRRLMEEMNLTCNVQFAFSFIYHAEFENGLKEYEFDHVYFGVSDEKPTPAVSEVKNWKYVSMKQLEKEMNKFPDQFTEWLKICFPQIKHHYELLKESGISKFQQDVSI